MIVICIVVVVIGSLLCALLKAEIDEWLGDSSMKRQLRLSLRRNQCNSQGTWNDPIEISDDESFGSSSNIQKSTTGNANVASCGTANVLGSVTDASKCNSKHDISDDLSNDEDVVVIGDGPKSPSLFDWNKPFLANLLHQNIFPGSSALSGHTSIESPNKRQKLMNEPTRWNFSSSNSSDEWMHASPKKDDPPPQVEIQHDYFIVKTRVKFPLKAYPCQVAVMSELIKGCDNEQNCLLESPTGSGKTLALLCAALAWQEQYSEKISREEMDVESCDDDDAVNNFFLNPSQYFDEKLHDKVSSKTKIPKKVPQIFYGMRTHRQIKQVITEFKRTAYRHKRMTILSSRSNTCIQTSNRNKDELCNELLDRKPKVFKDESWNERPDPILKVKRCQYYEHNKNNPRVFRDMSTPWDIEDLVSLGKGIKACPYFGARSLMADAEIIFCPYNYILCPDIRESMQINLKGNIVILDEAHNVEDICRKAANVTLRDDKINTAIKECFDLNLWYIKKLGKAIYGTILEYLTDIVKFLGHIEVNENGLNNDMVSKHWIGHEFRVLLDMHNVGCPRFPNFRNASMAAIEDFKINMKQEDPKKMLPTISQETKTILEHFCFAMEMIASDTFVDDYRMYVVETFETKKAENVRTTVKIRTMQLLCMNPAIVFAPLAHDARSVILASGTLTPTTSFQSELGTKFPYIANPSHIVPKEQVYIRGLSQGPKKMPLHAIHSNVTTFLFQDELGNLVLQVCDAVPHGVLCFFSSYNIMNKIHDRWKSNGMWKELSNLKKIFVEPKDNTKLVEFMQNYRRVIEESSLKSEQDYRVACGAVLFAVFRGKVAEGIDFKDNDARCVLVVGIPYLLKSNEIDMKMKYNDLNKSKGLLSGSEWYTVNAFRALNQAIGRCVRHKDDWGAVLLVDKRFNEERNIGYLPKWVRENKRDHDKWDYGIYGNLEIELQDFVVLQIARERGAKLANN